MRWGGGAALACGGACPCRAGPPPGRRGRRLGHPWAAIRSHRFTADPCDADRVCAGCRFCRLALGRRPASCMPRRGSALGNCRPGLAHLLAVSSWLRQRVSRLVPVNFGDSETAASRSCQGSSKLERACRYVVHTRWVQPSRSCSRPCARVGCACRAPGAARERALAVGHRYVGDVGEADRARH